MKKIYINGEFITLENETCEAILIEDKIISKVRMKKDILKYADDNTEIIDLKGKTMMPAFIDAHSHFFGVANNFLQISLENCTNIDEIQSKLREYIVKNNVTKEKWIIDGNYLRTLDVRLEACDTVFFLDYPLDVCLEGARSRIGKKREDLPWVEEEFDEEFRQWIMDFPKDQLPQMYELVRQYSGTKEVHILHSREEAKKHLELAALKK